MAWMIVSLTNPEPALRGRLRRYLIEISGMVFVGRPDARTQEFLEARVRETRGSAAIIRPDKNEMGFSIELINQKDVVLRDFDGLLLPTWRRSQKKSKVGTFRSTKNTQ